MSARALAALFLSLTFAAPAFAGKMAKMETFDDIKVEASGKVTPEQVKEAIATAARGRGWTPKEAGPGKLTATILVRGEYRVNVDIPYSADAFSVKYVSSENLGYEMTKKGPEIHRNYNKWVKTLVTDIQMKLSAL